MSSQEVVDFVNERMKTEAGKNRPLSAIIEEVSVVYVLKCLWFY